MLRHALAHRQHGAGGVVASSSRHVRRRRRRRRAEEVLEDPLAAHDRRGAVRIRRHRQDAALPEQPPRAAVVAQASRAGRAALDVRDAVVAREPFVDEGVVGRAGRARCDPRARCSRRRARSRGGTPAAGCRRSRESSAAPARRGRFRRNSHCPAKSSTSASKRAGRPSSGAPACRAPPASPQLPSHRDVEQLVVRDAAPQEEREPRGELEVADAVGRARAASTPDRSRPGTGTRG